MAFQYLRLFVAFLAANAIFLAESPSLTAGDGPNRVTPSDIVAGQWVDSLLGPGLDAIRPPNPVGRSSRGRKNQRSGAFRAKLVNNPDTSKGAPPFALIDRSGGVLRYIDPVEDIDLDTYLGETVGVRRDTGKTLLASQLMLPSGQSVQQAQHEEPIPAGEVVGESSILADPPDSDSGEIVEGGFGSGLDEEIDFGGCSQCGVGVYGCRSGCGSQGVLYAHREYLHWWLEGMNTPPLMMRFQDVDLGGSNAPEVIGPIDIIFGGNRVLEDGRNGARVTLGVWLDDCGQWGVEGEYLGLGEIDRQFSAGEKDGLVSQAGLFVGRPFFNTGVIGNNEATRGPSQEDVDTNRLDGSVTVDIRSEFNSAGIWLRHKLCCREGYSTCCGDTVGCGSGVGCSVGSMNGICALLRKGVRRTDVLYGFRWTSLDESLQINEDLQRFDAIPPAAIVLGEEIDVVDRFGTQNDFVGGEIGYETEWDLRRWSLKFLSKIAIGNTRQRVAINGSTTIWPSSGPDDSLPLEGGLLTQRFVHPGPDTNPGTEDDFVVGNIGRFERDEFSMIPEIGCTLGYDLTRRLKLTAGYTLIYWSNIVRPGDQIDLDINANLLPRNNGGLPDPATIVPGDHPRFAFLQTDLWAHGLNLGAEYTW
ncbi:MAG: BBP7 family outer membrane beta-barrel protein [Pirellulales bacterium]|nr:BBP7 family outer membrane beta-barrel protein [Pirellulales bacterium]